MAQPRPEQGSLDVDPTQPQTEPSPPIAAVWGANAVSDIYRAGEQARAAALGPATDLMLDLAGVREGSRVLDLGAGTGEQTIPAARRVGPSGSVLATDIHENMLALAAGAVREAGLSNVRTRIVDAQRLTREIGTFDAVISRLVIMLVQDPQAAVAGVRAVLAPGGRFAALVYGAPERNPFFWIPLTIARRHGLLPPFVPSRPGMFALGAEGRLESLLHEAGFRDVTVRTVVIHQRHTSTAEAITYLRQVPLLRAAMADPADAQHDPFWAEVAEAFQPFETSTGFEAPGEVLIGAGTA